MNSRPFLQSTKRRQSRRGTRVASVLILGLAVLCGAARAADGWKRSSEKDPLTGETHIFVRGYAAAGEDLRNFDVLKIDGHFVFRFVVPQLNHAIIEHHLGTSVIRSPEELGGELAWSVNGKNPHAATPDLSRKKAALMNEADYQASWSVGCEELRELAIGRTLRVVTPSFSGEFSLPGFAQQLEKVYGISQQALISRTADICHGAN